MQIEKKKLLQNVFEWDVVNWSVAVRFWEDNLTRQLGNTSALEIGAHSGGLSLWLALNGANVICSDRYEPLEHAREQHIRYGVASNIHYEKIDARRIPYENNFDIVAFKSVLGGVRGYFGDEAHIEVVNSILKSLKPGGQLLFAENLAGGRASLYQEEVCRVGQDMEVPRTQ